MGAPRADDTRPGDEVSLAELYELVPATEDFDAPPTPGQAQGMVEHVLDGEVIPDDDETETGTGTGTGPDEGD